MKHLILGSSGQIGTALAHYYKKKEIPTLPFDIVNAPEEDLRVANNPILRSRMEQADFIHFLAFDVGGSRYLKTYQHQQEFLSNNVRLMENTFDMLGQMKKPFIFASSQMSNMSYSPYGILKALGESYARALGGLIVKFWNVYGVEHDMNKSHVITDFLIKARDEKVIKMMTDGTEVRQFLHADDCSACLDILSERYSQIPRSMDLHITNFVWSSILEVAEIIAKIYPGTRVVPSTQVDDLQRDKRNEPDPAILQIWRPKIGLTEGIRLVNQGMLS